MIPQIQEVNFPEYATLHQATVNINTMGDRTITTQVRIDGDVVPDFGVTENGVFKPMELVFKGERFILPIREPQAKKDNTTRNSLVDLTFYSWPVYQLKRYFFMEMASINSGTAIADKYIASLALNLDNFVDAFNLVLDYYFDGEIQISLFGQGQGIYGTEPVFFDINYTKIWDVLQKVNELYDVRWWFDYDATTGVYYIKMGYTADSIDDHEFSYGYNGGLLSFERQVQDDNLANILLGRGGEKNLPYRYFKRIDEGNPGWAADPDAIPELANIYFDRPRDINFRWYVRGWMTNPNRDRTWENSGYVYPTYTLSSDSPYYFAFLRGKTDEKFNPVEFVKDDESIAKYGEFWGALDDNEEIYPTIQGVTIDPYGRIDEAVAISQIVTDDISAYAAGAAVETTIDDMFTDGVGSDTSYTIYSRPFTVPSGSTGNITYRPMSKERTYPNSVYYDTARSSLRAELISSGSEAPVTPSYDDTTGLYSISGLPAGTYRLKLDLVIRIDAPATVANGTFGIENIVLTTSAVDANAWKPTFDIWVKNIWQTTQGSDESNKDYSERVWAPILGDRLGNEAKIVFSTGPMSISEDYEFVIADYPVVDRTKTLNGVPSEWKITVYKSDAEFQATGLYIPNASSAQPTAGDKFFFTGIDMPHIYVLWAEERLNTYKANELNGMADISPTWVLHLDKVRINSLEDEDYGQKLADRLDAGVMIKTTDPRFTRGNVLTLYIQSITWTWNEPSKGNPYLVPDVEVVLADKVLTVQSPVAKLENDVSVISQSYVQSNDVEAVVRRVASSLFLKKTGESDSSDSPTTFSSKVTSRGFRKGGIGGTGWGLYEDNSRKFSASSGVATRAGVSEETEEQQNRSVLEVDRLVVREEMEVNNLVINQISYRGGCEIISAASIEVTLVRETATDYVCYFNQRQNSVANLFHVNDIAYGQVWSPDNTSLRFYKMRVSAVDTDNITLAKSGRNGSGVPQEGDVIVQYGNTTDASRQYVILRDVVGGGHDRMLSNLNSTSATGKEYYFAGIATSDTPRWFVGDRTGEYAEWYNGHLNIKGRFTVMKSDGSYEAMSDYINSVTQITNNLQSQIDGQIQSWAGDGSPLPIEVEGSVDPSTANYPANQWTNDTTRLKHMGDIYVDNTSGQGYRYTRQANNGDFYWMRISDEEVALALERANQALAGIAGMQYLTAALEGTTSIQGGLVLTSLIQLGQSEEGTFNVYSGINGTMDATAYGNGIAAWYGGPMTDHEADPTAQTYANALFRFDGSGYLAGGLLKWGVENGEAFLNLNGNAVIGGLGNVSLNDVANLMFDVVQYETGHYAAKLRGTAYYNGTQVALDGLFAEGWISAAGRSGQGGGGGGDVSALNDLSDVTISSPVDGQALLYDSGAWVNSVLSLGALSDVDLTTAPTAGQALVFDGTNWVPGSGAGGNKVFYGGVCQSSQSDTIKVVTCQGFTASDIVAGTTLFVVMKYENTVNSPRLNINSTGAYPILIDATTTQGSGYLAGWWGSMELVCLTFTGNGWNLGGGKIVATDSNYGQVKLIIDPDDLASHVNEYGYTGSAYCLNQIYQLAKSGGGGGGSTGVTSVAGYTGAVTATQLRTALPASASLKGVVMPMRVRNITAGNIISGGETPGRYYGVEINNSGQMFVNVPWVEGSTPSGSYLPLGGGTMTGSINSCAVLPTTAGVINLNSSGAVTSLGQGYDLGTDALPYRALRAKAVYLGKNSDDQDVYIYYDSVNDCVRIANAGMAIEKWISGGGVSTTS